MNPIYVLLLTLIYNINLNNCYEFSDGNSIDFNSSTNGVNLSEQHTKKGISKCCPAGRIVHTRKKCLKPRKWTMPNMDFSQVPVFNRYLTVTGNSLKDTFNIVPAKFVDDNFRTNAMEYVGDLLQNHHDFFLLEDGTLLLYRPDANGNLRSVEIAPDRFCIDYDHRRRRLNRPQPRFWIILPSIDDY